MFSNFLDESRRYSTRDNEDSALFVDNFRGKPRKNYGPKRPGNKGPKYTNLDKKCSYYKQKGYDESTYFKRYPNLRDKAFKKINNNKVENKNIRRVSDALFTNSNEDSKVEVLFSNIEDLNSGKIPALSTNSDNNCDKSAK